MKKMLFVSAALFLPFNIYSRAGTRDTRFLPTPTGSNRISGKIAHIIQNDVNNTSWLFEKWKQATTPDFEDRLPKK